jgi:hypothetical protein
MFPVKAEFVGGLLEMSQILLVRLVAMVTFCSLEGQAFVKGLLGL